MVWYFAAKPVKQEKWLFMKIYTIKATVKLENSMWVGIFERDDDEGYVVARHIFGAEPTDPELYGFVSEHYYELKFSGPQNHIKLVIKRKKYKRLLRDVRHEMQKMSSMKNTTRAQEVLRLALEKNKKIKKAKSRAQKEAEREEKFNLKQLKKKKKTRGH